MDLEWDGQTVEYTIGGYEKEGWNFTSRENSAVRRQAVSIEMLNAEAPKLICAMLEGLVVKRGKAFADADADGKIDENDMLTEAEIRSLYSSAGVNIAELLGLRLYTGIPVGTATPLLPMERKKPSCDCFCCGLLPGPLFEFYNTVLRAKGGKVRSQIWNCKLPLTHKTFRCAQVPFGSRYPGLEGEVTTGRFVTTIHAINSGIIKLSVLTPVITVYRGMSGLTLPRELEIPTKFGSLLGIEYGELSFGAPANCAGLTVRLVRRIHVDDDGQKCRGSLRPRHVVWERPRLCSRVRPRHAEQRGVDPVRKTHDLQ